MSSAKDPNVFSDNPKSKIKNPKYLALLILLLSCLATRDLQAQAKPLHEIKVGYPLGGSASYFWVAHRSGSFERWKGERRADRVERCVRGQTA